MKHRVYIRFCLSLIMTMLFVGKPSLSYGQEEEKVKIDGIYYLLDHKNKTAEVCEKNNKKGNDCKGNVVIPEQVNYKNDVYIVNSIGSYAFYRNKNLISVKIPNSVTSIGHDAFRCSGLTSISIPNSVTSIKSDAFSCSGLTSINIPNSVTSIESSTFEGCRGLTSINIPSSVTSIGSWAFRGCHSLTSINIPNSVTSIGSRAFEDCSILTSISIPNSVTSIENGTFSNCKSLTSIIIPYSVTSIGDFAFSYDHLRSLTICSPSPRVTENFLSLCSLDTVYIRPDCCLSFPYHWIEKVYLFSVYAESSIRLQIEEWQKKKEFETTAQWRARVTEESRNQKVQELTQQFKTEFIKLLKPKLKPFHYSVETYDADNSILPIHTDYGEFYFKIDMEEAQRIKANSSSIKLTPEYDINKDTLALASLVLAYDGKTWKPEQTVEISNQELALNLSPLELNFENDESENLVSKKVIVTDNSIDTNIPVAGNENKNTFAVIIGNENYQKVSRVEFAQNDANTFAAYCQKTLGLPEKNVRVYTDATYGTMIGAVNDIRNIASAYKGDINVIFYYAGHGIPNESSNDAYLLPVDADGRQMEICYPIARLYSELGTLDAKSVTVFMDACFSGSERGAGMLMAARGVAIKAKAAAPHGNMIVFSAASGDETAYPYKEKGHGLFTYFLLKKLQETKGDVSLGELGSYIIDNVTKESVVSNGKSQTPTVVPSASVESGWESMKLI